MSSKITTDLSVDDALVMDASYRFNPVDRRYIDDQIRGIEQHLVDALIRGRHATFIRVSASSAALVEGDVVCLASVLEDEPKVTKALSSPLTTAIAPFGVVVYPALPGAMCLVALGGVLPPTLTGLARYAPGFVRVNTTTGRCERVATLGSSDYGIGVVDNAGFMKVISSLGGGGGGTSSVTLTATIENTNTSWWRSAAREVNPNGKTAANFVVTLENSTHSTSWYTEAQLFNVTDQEIITGSTLNNQAASNRSLATEFTASLTVGSSAGQVKPTAKVYAVRLRTAGSPGITDRAILSGARIDWSA